MNRSHAATLLGISETATPSEVRKAYLTRARLLHPDRLVGGTQEDIAAANSAMAQLNQAYEVMQSPPSTSPLTEDKNSGNRTEDFGFPAWSDASTSCDLCGWGPAIPVKFNSVSGFVIFWRWYTLNARLCKACARAMYDENQRNTLVKGWWGLLSFFATIFVFFSNMTAFRRTRTLSAPQGRYPGAYTISPIPLVMSTPWWKRPSAIIASLVAIVVSLGILGVNAESGGTSGSGGTSPQQSSVYDSIGVCLSEDSAGNMSEEPCDSSRANFIIVSIDIYSTSKGDPCGGGEYVTTESNQNLAYCIEPY